MNHQRSALYLVLLLLVGCGGDAEITPPTSTPPLPPPPPSPLEAERAALEALYNATGGASWSRRDNWLTGAPVNDWHGVATHANTGRVYNIDLRDNGLTGSIPADVEKFEDLVGLYLGGNRITGSIPAEIGKLSRLQYLDLGSNELAGPIPPLGALLGLRSIRLLDNRLAGTIPPEIGGLGRLVSLILRDNQLTGSIPAELGNAKGLERLVVATNPDLAGLMPRTMLNLRQLEVFAAHGTGLCAPLDGTFSAWLNRIASVSVEECDDQAVERLALQDLFTMTDGDAWTDAAGWNTDADLGSWHGVTVEDGRVRSIVIPDNALKGSFPTALVTLAALERLDFSGNELAGKLPADVGHMSSLAAFNLTDNADLEGLLPFSMVGMASLAVLRYEGTGLCIPPTRGFQAWVTGLDVLEGPLCTDQPGVALALPMVYHVQSIQQPSAPVPMVANRDALLRVFLTAPTLHGFVAPPIVATFSRGGEQVYQVRVEASGNEFPAAVSQGDLDVSYNAVIPAEHIQRGIEFVVEADPDGSLILADDAESRYPAEGTVPLGVVEVPPMELTIVPVLNATAPDSSIFNWVSDVTADSHIVSFLRWAFPFAAFEARTRETYVTSRDLTASDGQWGLILDLEAVRSAENGTGYYYGAALSKTGLVRGIARLGGWVSMGKPLVTEVAHEVGHSLDLSHAPCGDAGSPDPDFPYVGGGIGAWGYDFRDGVVVNRGAADVMGYCHPAWISDYSYKKVIDHRSHWLTGGSRPQSSQLVLSGGVLDGELKLEPPYWLAMSPRAPSRPGPYRIEGFSGPDLRFSLNFTPGEDKHGNRYFVLTVPVEQGDVDRVVLSGPEGEVIVGEHDDRTVTILRDETGSIRGMLRDWNEDIPETLGHPDDLDVVSFRGLRPSESLR